MIPTLCVRSQICYSTLIFRDAKDGAPTVWWRKETTTEPGARSKAPGLWRNEEPSVSIYGMTSQPSRLAALISRKALKSCPGTSVGGRSVSNRRPPRPKWELWTKTSYFGANDIGQH